MSKQFGVVILNRYPELAEKFIASIRATHKKLPQILVVRDRNDMTYGDDIEVVDGKVPFAYTHNANIGLLHFKNKDVVLCNDDLVCLQDDFFWKLHEIANQYPLCGLMSPLIKGGVGNKFQSYSQCEDLWRGMPNEIVTILTVCFPCVLIKRKTMDTIGYLDECITNYGLDDMDYCLRAFQAGFLLMITKQLHIQHGDGNVGLDKGHNFSLSYAREAYTKTSLEYIKAKHGIDEYARE